MNGTYSDTSFWEKAGSVFLAAGRKVMEPVLTLYYVLQKPEVPIPVKAEIIAALAYFILPFDLIPDAIPVAGYSDDLAVLAAVVAQVAMYVDDDVRARVDGKLREWFGA